MLKRIVFAVLAVAVICLGLCSCKIQPQNDEIPPFVKNDPATKPVEDQPSKDTVQDISKEEVSKLAEEALIKLKTIPEYPEGYPTLDDVVAQYKKACQAIGWIVNTELAASDGDYGYDAHGMTYYKVLPDCYLGAAKAGKDPDAEKLIYNKETLEAYLATLISADEARDYVLDIDDSFEIPKFVEAGNGALYVLPYAFPPAGYGDDSTDTFDLTANDDGSYTLSVHYNTLDDEDNVEATHTYDVKYVNKDGRWVFENFLLVKQH